MLVQAETGVYVSTLWQGGEARKKVGVESQELSIVLIVDICGRPGFVFAVSMETDI